MSTMNGPSTGNGEMERDSDEATWRTELSNLLGPTNFPCTGHDATANLLRVHAPSRLLSRLNVVPPQLRFPSLDSLIAYIDAHSKPKHPVEVSQLDAKERADIRLQEMIDDLARSSRGPRPTDVVAQLVETIADAHLQAKPQPWLAAVAAEAINGNAYVLTAATALLGDVPQPTTHCPEKSIT